MSNSATYLTASDKSKLKRIAEKAQASESKVLQCVVRFMPEDYLIELVQNYKGDLKIEQ